MEPLTLDLLGMLQVNDMKEQLNERKLQVEELQLQLGKREEELAQSLMRIDEEGAGTSAP